MPFLTSIKGCISKHRFAYIHLKLCSFKSALNDHPPTDPFIVFGCTNHDIPLIPGLLQTKQEEIQSNMIYNII